MKGGSVMKRLMLTAITVVAAALLIGCQAHRPAPINPDFQAADLSDKVRSGELRQKVDNFYVILDSSGSKEETYRGNSKFAIAKDFVYRMNRTIPGSVYINGALRSFGHSGNPFAKKTTLHYGPTQWSSSSFEAALEKINWGGGLSPADMAIDSASGDMATLSGKTAVILVGDGQYKGYDPVGAAQRMKARFGDRVCLYTVLVGSEDPENIKTMKAISAASECGSYQTVKYLDKPSSLAAWVEAVFFESAAKPAPPPPPAPGDADGDGVVDGMDQCANTPRGAPVNSAGCWIIPNVLFDFNEAGIRLDYRPLLDRVAMVMGDNPDLRFSIGGHTCNIGSERYNEGLSDRRANAVKQYLMGKGVPGNRLFTRGYGFSVPAASNDTEAGRKLNRRATLRWSR
jgi:OOP family OmpA-OmpF porin